MKSPITDKEMTICSELRIFFVDGIDIEVEYKFYLCEESGEKYTDIKLDTEFLNNIEKYLLKM